MRFYRGRGWKFGCHVNTGRSNTIRVCRQPKKLSKFWYIFLTVLYSVLAAACLTVTVFIDWQFVFLTLFAVILLISFTVSFKNSVFYKQVSNEKEQVKNADNYL